jgi:hypothetical protein
MDSSEEAMKKSDWPFVAALYERRSSQIPAVNRPPLKKDVKIDGTNSASSLESTKVSKKRTQTKCK